MCAFSRIRFNFTANKYLLAFNRPFTVFFPRDLKLMFFYLSTAGDHLKM